MKIPYFDLTDVEGYAYISDSEGYISSMNDEMMKLLNLSAIEGRKKLEDLNMADGYLLDINNQRVIQNRQPYFEISEFFGLKNAGQGSFMISKKRLIFCDDKVAGIYNQSTFMNDSHCYDPNKVFSMNNVQLGLKIRENINALYAFKAHKDNPLVDQKILISAMFKILDKMRLTMDGIVLANDHFNNVKHYKSEAVYTGLHIGDFNSYPSSKRVSFSFVEIEHILQNPRAYNEISQGTHALIYMNLPIYQFIKENKKELLLHQHNTLFLVVDDAFSYDLRRNILKISPFELMQRGSQMHLIWRSYIKNVIRYNAVANEELRILSIEDDIDSRNALCSLLEIHSNVSVQNCQSGQEALLKVEKRNYDLIILDINLGDISGFTLAKEIRNIQRKRSLFYSMIYVNTGYDYDGKVNHLDLDIDKIYLKPNLILDIKNIIEDLTKEKESNGPK